MDQKIDQINLSTGKRFIINGCFNCRPYLGVSYTDISRRLEVNYETLVPTLEELTLKGVEKSDYWGIGPLIGADFSFPLYRCLYLDGNFEGGLLIGSVKSNVTSTQTDANQAITDHFNVDDNYSRAAPFFKSQLALAYRPHFNLGCFGLEVKAGYETDYYYKTVDRINPLNGYLINPDPIAIKTSSNWGMGGPFVNVSLKTLSSEEINSCFFPQSTHLFSGFYARFTSSWLESKADKNDLVYAVLNNNEGPVKNLETSFSNNWAGTYELGYQFCDHYHLSGTYFHYDDEASTSTTANPDQFISSLNSSGDILVRYSGTSSKVNYDLDQADLKLGKTFASFCGTELNLELGLRYSKIERTLHDKYEGGDPSLNFENKDALLKSHFTGLGPLFSITPIANLYDNFHLKTNFSTSLLTGHIKSTLDQTNTGDLGSSSNTLSTPWARTFTPVIDLSAALHYHIHFACGVMLQLEAGYQMTRYYKAINLVYPTLRTGLEQTNSDLRLQGPYFSLQLACY